MALVFVYRKGVAHKYRPIFDGAEIQHRHRRCHRLPMQSPLYTLPPPATATDCHRHRLSPPPPATGPPRHATPRHATPHHATPRFAVTRHATPRRAAPRHDTPRFRSIRCDRCSPRFRRTLCPSFDRGRVNALVRFVAVGAVRRSRACVVRVPLTSVSYVATLRTRVLHS